MDNLREIFEMQRSLNDYLIQTRKLEGLSDEEWLRKYMMAMFCEMAELLEETNYNWWKNPKEINQEALKEELVDILHFFVSMCLRAGLDAEELHHRYMEKNKENFLRQQGKGKKDGYELKQEAETEH